jgi:hypothetical protein
VIKAGRNLELGVGVGEGRRILEEEGAREWDWGEVDKT